MSGGVAPGLLSASSLLPVDFRPPVQGFPTHAGSLPPAGIPRPPSGPVVPNNTFINPVPPPTNGLLSGQGLKIPGGPITPLPSVAAPAPSTGPGGLTPSNTPALTSGPVPLNGFSPQGPAPAAQPPMTQYHPDAPAAGMPGWPPSLEPGLHNDPFLAQTIKEYTDKGRAARVQRPDNQTL